MIELDFAAFAAQPCRMLGECLDAAGIDGRLERGSPEDEKPSQAGVADSR